MADSVGMADLRAENVSKIVTGFALQTYTMKTLCLVQGSSSWKETYQIETAADLTASGTRNVKGVSRLANFPDADVTWTEASSRHIKHAVKGTISWEDATTNEIDVVARTLLRIARAVTKSVDTEIWNTLVEVVGSTPTPVNINSVSINAGNEWDSATIANQDPIQDILNAIKEIAVDNYNPYSNGHLLVTPKDFANLMGNANVRNAGQFFTSDVTRNGRVGRILGLNIIVSNSVTDDYAAVVIAKEACTWKTAKGLTVNTIEDPGIKFTIRAWEVGTAQLKNPEAVCLISNTQA